MRIAFIVVIVAVVVWHVQAMGDLRNQRLRVDATTSMGGFSLSAVCDTGNGVMVYVVAAKDERRTSSSDWSSSLTYNVGTAAVQGGCAKLTAEK